ncbi:hypothetical protein LNV09_03160 [Paucibacter sp. B2R-40]|uniref:hypothetical protein n=1 Tax=Paucibacter sp. B2R-40 TaxID=2893554 RepID=UPI0021E5061C|nr:hypothetical protein [Paucibacter sp. B2R-40]MCV2353158.1 hypothetical protein [Paucibacter sp. B2R-40]
MNISLWLLGLVAYLIALLTACVCADASGGKRGSAATLGQLALLLVAPLPFAYFGLISANTALWVIAGFALALTLLFVAADMNIPSGSKMPGFMMFPLLPLIMVVALPYRVLAWVSKRRRSDRRD